MEIQFKKRLNQPYPLILACRQGRIWFVLMIMVVNALLDILQPLGLSNWHEYHKGVVLFVYSIVYYGTYGLIYLIGSTFFIKHFKAEHWTLGKELRVLLAFIPSVVFTTLVYGLIYVQEFQLSIDAFFQLLKYDGLLGISTIPLFGYLISFRLKPEKCLPAITPPVTEAAIDDVTLKSTCLNPINIILSEIVGNVLHIHHTCNGEVYTLHMNMTLSEFEKQVSDYTFLKHCHRSYMVNINYIASWSGTSKNMKLHVHTCTKYVPVSRDLIDEFKKLMELLAIPKHK